MLPHALAYAARGWPVLPVHTPKMFGPKTGPARATCSCGKPACGSPGKHPRTHRGLKDATTDRGQIYTWWSQWPDANIGLRTGVAFDVLDLDGDEALDSIDAMEPTAPEFTGPMVITGRGIHVYFAPTSSGNRTAIAPGVDWRGIDGYVIAPPSIHYEHGDRYEWSTEHGPDDPLLAPPPWILARHLDRPHNERHTAPGATRYGRSALDAELAALATSREGERNHALNRAAFKLGQLIPSHLDLEAVVPDLLTVAERIGLTPTEAAATIRSGIRSGHLHPRTSTEVSR